LYYGDIKKVDVANGVGVRVSIFVSGCPHHCKGCFNEETWNFEYGQPYTKKQEDDIIKYMAPDHITGLTLLGGEPMFPTNQEALLPFLLELKKALQKKTVWIYTGFTFEELFDEKMRCCTKYTEGILSCTDILVDGPFLIEKKNISLPFRGSENQRIIDVKESLKEGKPVLSPLMR